MSCPSPSAARPGPGRPDPWRPERWQDFELTDVRAVLPHEVLPHASVEVRDGRISAIRRGTRIGRAEGTGVPTIDGGGLLLLPGLVDVHSDGLEAAVRPRPRALLPGDQAVASVEARLLGTGVTTAFHPMAHRTTTALGRPLHEDPDLEVDELLRSATAPRMDHRVLHRLDVLCGTGRARLLEVLAAARPEPSVPALVSLEDHTPGQGQYHDQQAMVRLIRSQENLTADAAQARVQQLHRRGQESAGVRAAAFEQLVALQARGRVRLLLHDPDTARTVESFARAGGAVAEFPTTLEAARSARAQGLLVVAGAPNLLRGGSHSGNVSAAELVDLELVDALASDYVPGSLLGAASIAARTRGWAEAARLVTSGPASVAGLEDRGALEPGRRADLILVDDQAGPWPIVRWARSASTAP